MGNAVFGRDSALIIARAFQSLPLSGFANKSQTVGG